MEKSVSYCQSINNNQALAKSASHAIAKKSQNRLFPSCFEPHHESEAKCKIFIMKISLHSYANKTHFHNEVHNNSEMAYLRDSAIIRGHTEMID